MVRIKDTPVLRRIFRGLCTKPVGRTLIAGTIGVLVGVECLISRRKPVPAPPANPNPVLPRSNYLKVYRTKSELGYVYWVVQGFGSYKCFVLHDSWREAIADAEHRMRGPSVPDEQFATAGSRT
jgi:hypothetical protein